MKFTDRGGRVSVSLQLAPGDQTAIIQVKDTGVGLEQRAMTQLFEPFTQHAPHLARGRDGLGLGLPLVKGMIELHGGTVQATSDGPGHGSLFTIRLPLEPAEPLTEESPPMITETKPPRILIIEDNEDSAESISMVLEFAGHEVAVAHTGADGLKKAKAFKPDIVLCDIGLPDGMDGYDVARALRKDGAFASTFLIAMTGYGRDEDRQHAIEAGFHTHLTKPVDPTSLAQLVSKR